MDQLHNIRKKQNLIGTVGEVIVCFHLRQAVRTRVTHLDYLNNLKDKIPENILIFLKHNWHHFDIFSIDDENKVHLTEVKTKQHRNYASRLFNLEKITKESLDAYKQAEQLGIDIKLALVRFHNDWNYTVGFKEFSKVKFWVDKRQRPFHGRRI